MGSTVNVLLAIATRGMRSLVCIGSERIHPPQMPLGLAWEVLRRYFYGSLDAVVALTAESAAWLKAYTRVKRVPLIPNAVPWPLPLQEPTLSVDKYVSDHRRLLLSVSRLDRQKGFDLLIQAFSNLASKHPNWGLVILSEGPLRGQLEYHVQEFGLGGRVLLPGLAGNIGGWYRRADLYVLSSRFEGFPNTLVEAMAYGVPVVSFDCDTGPRNIIRHEVDGLFVPPADVKGLVAALDMLMDN